MILPHIHNREKNISCYMNIILGVDPVLRRLCEASGIVDNPVLSSFALEDYLKHLGWELTEAQALHILSGDAATAKLVAADLSAIRSEDRHRHGVTCRLLRPVGGAKSLREMPNPCRSINAAVLTSSEITLADEKLFEKKRQSLSDCVTKRLAEEAARRMKESIRFVPDATAQQVKAKLLCDLEILEAQAAIDAKRLQSLSQRRQK